MLSARLRYFLEVARCGSLSEASQHLRITVSAVSRQIANLESELATPLFERTHRGMTLTPAGVALQGYATRSLADSERVTRLLRAGVRDLGPHVRVVTSDGLSHLAVDAAIAAQGLLPGLDITLHVAASEEIAPMVREGAADLGLGFRAGSAQDVTILGTWSSAVCAMARAGHPLAGRGEVGIADLLEFNLVLPAGNSLGRLVALLGALRPREGRGVLQAGTLDCMLRTVEGSDAVGIVTAISLRDRIDAARCVRIPLSLPPLGPRTVSLYAPRGRAGSEAEQRFAALLMARLAG